MIEPIRVILSNWNVNPTFIETLNLHPNVTKVNARGETFYLKKRGDPSIENRLEEYYLTSFLLENRNNVESPLLTRSHQPFIKEGQHFYSLYEALDGAPLHEYSVCSLINAGEYLSNLHLTLENYFPHNEITCWNIEEHIRQWMDELGSTPVGRWGRGILSILDGWTILYNQIPHQLVHSDCNPGNILIKEEVVTGIIDFERIRMAPRIADIGYFIAGMLKDMVKVDREVTFDYINVFLRGYDQRGALADEEKEVLSLLVLIFLLQYTFYYDQRGYSEIVSSFIPFIDDLAVSKKYDQAFKIHSF